jgi:hypothetical protein
MAGTGKTFPSTPGAQRVLETSLFMTSQSHTPWFNHLNIWWRVQLIFAKNVQNKCETQTVYLISLQYKHYTYKNIVHRSLFHRLSITTVQKQTTLFRCYTRIKPTFKNIFFLICEQVWIQFKVKPCLCFPKLSLPRGVYVKTLGEACC